MLVTTISGQFDILAKVRTVTVSRMFLMLAPEKVRVMRESLSSRERASVAARLREEGFKDAAQVVLA